MRALTEPRSGLSEARTKLKEYSTSERGHWARGHGSVVSELDRKSSAELPSPKRTGHWTLYPLASDFLASSMSNYYTFRDTSIVPLLVRLQAF